MDISNILIELTKENVNKYINPDDVYKHYLGSKLVYGRAFSSPFREDKNPSFVINQGSGYFKDFATGDSGDCFSFVMKMYNINFYDALKQIVYDLGISDKFLIINKNVLPTKKLKVENVSSRGTFQGEFNLKVKTRKYEQHDLDYWNSYGISLKYLKLGDIYPITHFFINDKQYIAEKYSYVYVENKDGVESYKVYQPFSKVMKWINGNNYSVWELWKLLPKNYDELIITSSRKDALAIIENCGIPSTSFQAESIYPKPHVVKDILSRFKRVYLLYDNDYTNPDNPGQKLAQKRIQEYGFINLVIPKHYHAKDFSDLVYKYGRTDASGVLNNLITRTKEIE